MAKITFKRQSEYGILLGKFADAYWIDKALRDAVHEGAGIVADAIRSELESLPEEKFRHLDYDEKFSSVPTSQKRDLIDGFGLSPIRDKDGFVHAKAGFEGYGHYPTNTYPQGIPNEYLARVVESGSSVRDKNPFVRPAIKKSRKEAIEAMEKSIDENIKKIFEGG